LQFRNLRRQRIDALLEIPAQFLKGSFKRGNSHSVSYRS
jgi:hypothetical protein